MSQNDMVTANQTFPNCEVRFKWCITSTSQWLHANGTSAPSTTYGYQMWVTIQQQLHPTNFT